MPVYMLISRYDLPASLCDGHGRGCRRNTFRRDKKECADCVLNTRNLPKVEFVEWAAQEFKRRAVAVPKTEEEAAEAMDNGRNTGGRSYP